eukprot:Amastigsp_a345351_13.p1 type:complete len:598 gc:universal Amastigsp_a345351_13:72-1865(+)
MSTAAARLALLVVVGVVADLGLLAAAQSAELCGQTLSPTVCFENVPPCGSTIFCSGPMLQLFQFSGLFNDSKTFVDSPLKAPESVVSYMFQPLLPNPTTAQLAAFFAQWFEPAGSDLVPVVPEDWSAAPPMLAAIADPTLASWASAVNGIWKALVFAVNESVFTEPDQHSLLALPEPFVVPGDRFRESYYWDEYWIVKGLLAVNMSVTAEGVLENFLYLVDHLGFIPNGGRQYYTDRSQPPLLTQMVWDFYAYSGNVSFLAYAWPALEIEYQYWMSEASVALPDGGVVNQYVATTGMPRPEGFLEDIATAEGIYDPTARACLFSELSSVAATGWDFSSRWFADSLTIQQSCVRSLAPIDLNAIMYLNENTLSQMATVLQRPNAAAKYAAAAAARLEILESLFWSEDAGLWVDLNITSMAPASKPTPYLSSMVPLWARAYDASNTSRVSRALATLVGAQLFDFPGGVPTSLLFTDQQWDTPNAWAPLQWIAIEGLRATGLPEAAELASALISTWVSSNAAAYAQYGLMFEKYDARAFGQPGGLGEYAPQSGFGWTNGVVLDLLARFPDTVRVTSAAEATAALRAATESLAARLSGLAR